MTDKPAFVIEAIPRDVPSVLRHEAKDARAGTMVVRQRKSRPGESG